MHGRSVPPRSGDGCAIPWAASMHLDLLARLVELVPPPDQPKRHSGNWEDVEDELAVVLPTQYKAFINLYGQGVLCSVLQIESPFDLDSTRPLNSGGPSAWSSVRAHWMNMAASYHDWGEVVPYPTYPKSPGLLPFGSFGDSDLLAWFTDGAPDSWPIVFHKHAEGYFETRQSFLMFLLAAINGESSFPKQAGFDELLNYPRVFVPG